jgi:hypothetical protein
MYTGNYVQHQHQVLLVDVQQGKQADVELQMAGSAGALRDCAIEEWRKQFCERCGQYALLCHLCFGRGEKRILTVLAIYDCNFERLWTFGGHGAGQSPGVTGQTL